jgi:hypothetical protein
MGSSWGLDAVVVVGVPMLGVLWESRFVFILFEMHAVFEVQGVPKDGGK